MGGPKGKYRSSIVLRIQCYIYLAGSKRTTIYSQIRLQLAYFTTKVLLFLITTPTYVLLLASKTNMSPTADLVFSRALGAVVFLAYYADGQQWSKYTKYHVQSLNTCRG